MLRLDFALTPHTRWTRRGRVSIQRMQTLSLRGPHSSQAHEPTAHTARTPIQYWAGAASTARADADLSQSNFHALIKSAPRARTTLYRPSAEAARGACHGSAWWPVRIHDPRWRAAIHHASALCDVCRQSCASIVEAVIAPSISIGVVSLGAESGLVAASRAFTQARLSTWPGTSSQFFGILM